MKKISLGLILLLFVVNTYSQNVQNEYEEWKSSQDYYPNARTNIQGSIRQQISKTIYEDKYTANTGYEYLTVFGFKI